MTCIAQQIFFTQQAPMLAERVGANIKAARLAKAGGRGWSLEKLAARVNPPTSYQHIARLEKGGTALNLEWVEKIGAALDADPMELLSGEPARPMFPQMNEQAASAYSQTLVALATGEPDPDEGIVQVVALALQGIVRTLAEDPEAATNPQMARLAANLLGRQYVPVAN